LRVVGPPYMAPIRGDAGGSRRTDTPMSAVPPVGGLSQVRRDWPRLRTTRTGKAQSGTALAGWPDARGDVRTLRMVTIRPPAVGVHLAAVRSTIYPGKGHPSGPGNSPELP
jgi:hypothetical protein